MRGVESTKQDFGRFVADHRRAMGLTQRGLAARLHVTESAVSKWERGLSYPDITMVPALARELGVSGDELMNASEDREARDERLEARSYRAWRSSLLWTTSIACGAAVLASFIVNLSVSHALSWFWIVLAAVGLAFSLTTLPMLRIPARGRVVLGSSLVCLFALFGITALYSDSGRWVPIAISAVLLAVVVVLGPVWLYSAGLPRPFSEHLTVLSLLLDTVAVVLFLLVVMLSIGRVDLWASPALALVAIGLAPVWAIALMLRYLPIRTLYTAALAVAFGGVYGFFADGLVSRAIDETPRPRAYDLGQWHGAYISGNVQLLVTIGCLLVAALLAVLGTVLRARQTTDQGDRASARTAPR